MSDQTNKGNKQGGYGGSGSGTDKTHKQPFNPTDKERQK